MKCAARSRCARERCAHEAADERCAGRARRNRGQPRTLAGDDRGVDRYARDSSERDVSRACAASATTATVSSPARSRAARRPRSSTMPPRCRRVRRGSSSPTRWRPYLALGGASARARARSGHRRDAAAPARRRRRRSRCRRSQAAGRAVTATPENENNEIGVAKFLLSLDDGDERVAIVEFGARKYRDLDPLVRAARPDIGVLTNIGEAHLEIMGSRERLAETKWGIFDGGARAVLNLADDESRRRAPRRWRSRRSGSASMRSGRPAARARSIVRIDDVLAIAAGDVRALPLHVDVPGDYNRRNLAAALAAAWAAGVDPATVAAAAPHVRVAARPLRAHAHRRRTDHHLRCLQRFDERRARDAGGVRARTRTRAAHRRARQHGRTGSRCAGDAPARRRRGRRVGRHRAGRRRLRRRARGGRASDGTRAGRARNATRPTTMRSRGCASTRGPTISCCSKARACTAWSRSSRGCRRDPGGDSRTVAARRDSSRFRCARA